MVQAVRTSWQWNLAVYDPSSKTYTTPVTNEKYTFSHLSDINCHCLKFETKIEGSKIKGTVNVKVIFDHHCYTREKNPSDISLPVLVVDKYDDGTIKERVFDADRFAFTFKLLEIIKNLDHKSCLGSRRNLKANKAIRIENRDRSNPKKGIYIVMKIKRFSSENADFTLYVETCHSRNTMPHGMDLANAERKHMLVLGDWLREQYPEFVSETKKP